MAGPHGSPLSGAGTGAGVAIVKGFKRTERRPNQMGSTRVKGDIGNSLFREDFVSLTAQKCPDKDC